VNWYDVTLTRGGQIINRGWQLAMTEKDLIEQARKNGFNIDIRLIGSALPQFQTQEILQ